MYLCCLDTKERFNQLLQSTEVEQFIQSHENQQIEANTENNLELFDSDFIKQNNSVNFLLFFPVHQDYNNFIFFSNHTMK